MAENETDDTVQSLPDPMPGTPVPPLTPFNTWTWTTPVIPQFYYNVYSPEQRIRQICVEIGRIQAYLSDVVPYANRAHALLDQRINELEAELEEEVARLDAAIQQEIADRTAGDENLQSQVDTVVSDLATETEERKNADTQLQENIDQLDTDLRALIAAEEAARIEADNTLQTNIDNEEAARIAADNTLTAADERIQDSLDTEIANRQNADNSLQEQITNEAETRAAQDTALGERIDMEVAARQQADATLQEADTTLQSNIDAEATARETADDALQTGLNERPKADQIVGGDGIEVTYEMDSDAGDGTLVTITSTVEADIDTLTQRIAAEEDARESADTALGARIDDEITNRDDADDELWTAVHAVEDTSSSNTTLITQVSEDLASEVTAREEADTALSDRVTALEDADIAVSAGFGLTESTEDSQKTLSIETGGTLSEGYPAGYIRLGTPYESGNNIAGIAYDPDFLDNNGDGGTADCLTINQSALTTFITDIGEEQGWNDSGGSSLTAQDVLDAIAGTKQTLHFDLQIGGEGETTHYYVGEPVYCGSAIMVDGVNPLIPSHIESVDFSPFTDVGETGNAEYEFYLTTGYSDGETVLTMFMVNIGTEDADGSGVATGSATVTYYTGGLSVS